MCISTTPHSRSAHSAASWGSERSALTSLTISAPASSAAAATVAFDVSIEIGAPASARPSSTGPTRRSSSPTVTPSDPGRVDSPPTSSRSAPSPTSSCPCSIARPGSRNMPPSENESGVTLTTPMTRNRSPRSLMPLQYRCRLVAGGPGNRTPMSEREPHHDLNNPVEEPDPTEWPDPYEKRRDPKGPEEGDEEPAP